MGEFFADTRIAVYDYMIKQGPAQTLWAPADAL